MNRIPRSSDQEPKISPRRTYDNDYVRTLFDGIAHRYDFLNHVLSAGIDILWRRRAIDLLGQFQPREILDLATGTGDLAFEAVRLHPHRIVGLDASDGMLERARAKAAHRGVPEIIEFRKGSAEHLPFSNGTFDAAMIAFGVRNFTDLDAGLQEVRRVLKPGGNLIVLEFSRPRLPLIGALYGFYSTRVLPMIGGLLSGSPEAYTYLPRTIQEFPDGIAFAALLGKAGFQSVAIFPQTFGIATIYHASKRSDS